jgi:hypothetical protein
MTVNRDFNDVARAWLDLMPSEITDRALAAVIETVEDTPQERPWLAGRWRPQTMSRLLLAGAAAVLAVAAGVILITPRRAADVAAPPAPPSASPSTSARAGGDRLDDALRARWIATASAHPLLGNGSGPVALSVTAGGNGMSAENFGPGHGYASSAGQIGVDQLELVLEQDGGDCTAGTRGVYRWALFSNRSQLVLTKVSDPCEKRAAVLARTWVRSLVGATTMGAGVVDTMNPDFAITLPDDAYQTRTLDDFAEIAGTHGNSLMAFKNPQPFVDPCSDAEERVPYKPGAAAFVDHFRNNDAFEVSEATPLKIDGHDAIHVTIGGKSNYSRCPGRELYQYTPKTCECHFVVGQGYADSMYLVEVGSDTFLFILSPFGAGGELDAILSIRIPYELPAR